MNFCLLSFFNACVLTIYFLLITAVIMYSNAKPVIISNAAAYTKLKVRQAIFDPIHNSNNISQAEAVALPWRRGAYEFPT
jgi:hypothetical protein